MTPASHYIHCNHWALTKAEIAQGSKYTSKENEPTQQSEHRVDFVLQSDDTLTIIIQTKRYQGTLYTLTTFYSISLHVKEIPGGELYLEAYHSDN